LFEGIGKGIVGEEECEGDLGMRLCIASFSQGCAKTVEGEVVHSGEGSREILFGASCDAGDLGGMEGAEGIVEALAEGVVIVGMESAFLEPHLDGGVGVIGEGLCKDFLGMMGERACLSDYVEESTQGAQWHLGEVLGKRERGEVMRSGFE
jgi:hypothetical protein